MKDIDDPMSKMLQKMKKKEGGSDNDSDIPAWYLFLFLQPQLSVRVCA